MSILNKIKMMAVAAALTAGTAFGGSFTIGGTIQTINVLTASGEQALDFTSPATLLTIATLTVSNNTDSYDLQLSFTNLGEFLKPAAAAGTGVALTACTLNMSTPAAGIGSGGWGTGIASLDPTQVSGASHAINSNILARIQTAGPAIYTWTPADQTTATVGAILTIKGSWAASTKLAGNYKETVTATLIATIN